MLLGTEEQQVEKQGGLIQTTMLQAGKAGDKSGAWVVAVRKAQQNQDQLYQIQKQHQLASCIKYVIHKIILEFIFSLKLDEFPLAVTWIDFVHTRNPIFQ